MIVAGDGVDIDPQRRVPIRGVARGEVLRGRDEQQHVEQRCDAETFEHHARFPATVRLVEHAARSLRAGASHGTSVGFSLFGRPKKEKPGGGNAGSDLVVIGVYGFKYAAWLLLVAPEGAERLVFIVQPTFFSCSSTFLFFSNVFKFNRTLCGFASFSVRLRTHSSLGGDDSYEARHMPVEEKPLKSTECRKPIARYLRKTLALVKAVDTAFRASRSCGE